MKAIKHGKGPMLVLAGPGSGKTFVMIQRVLNLIHEKQIRPDNILVISFSKASTIELKQRFQKQSKEKVKESQVNEFQISSIIDQKLSEQNQDNNRVRQRVSEKFQDNGRVTEGLSDETNQKNNSETYLRDETKGEVNFATFHACFFHILKETYHYNSQDIITEKQKRDILKTILLDPEYGECKEEEKYLQYSKIEKEEYKKFSIKNEIEKVDQFRENRFTGKKAGRKQNILYQKESVKEKNELNQSITRQKDTDVNAEKLFYQNEIKNITEKTEEYLQKISYYKNKGMKELKEKEKIQFQKIFRAYNDEMHRQHKLDFDDMGLLCLQLFQTQPDVLEKWQEKFQYVLIDEFQDINMIQFRIVQLLVYKYQNLFVVGDDDQAIYGFRGSNPQIMLDFEKYYPNAEKVLLETNYRCSEQIVKEALKVIEQNKIRFQKEIRAYGGTSEEKEKILRRVPDDRRIKYQEVHVKGIRGKKYKNEFEPGNRLQKSGINVTGADSEDVIYLGFENCQKEYSYIEEQINKFTAEQKHRYSDIACIFRTNQDMTGLAEYFARNKIPFVMKEKCNSIFKHFIALDMRAYLQFFFEGKKRGDFIRIMNKPLRYMSRNALSYLNSEEITWKVLKKYYSTKKYMIANIEQLEQNEKWIQKLDLYGACFYIRKVIGYENYLKEHVKEQNMNWEEAREILDFVQESIRNMQNLEEWKEYIEQYEEALKNSDEEKEGVHIITMHVCKGLEYPIVFLPDCNEGKVPHKKAVSREEIEEERRMFYVAMTRAKSHLEILYIEDEMKRHLQKSRFLKHTN